MESGVHNKHGSWCIKPDNLGAAETRGQEIKTLDLRQSEGFDRRWCRYVPGDLAQEARPGALNDSFFVRQRQLTSLSFSLQRRISLCRQKCSCWCQLLTRYKLSSNKYLSANNSNRIWCSKCWQRSYKRKQRSYNPEPTIRRQCCRATSTGCADTKEPRFIASYYLGIYYFFTCRFDACLPNSRVRWSKERERPIMDSKKAWIRKILIRNLLQNPNLRNSKTGDKSNSEESQPKQNSKSDQFCVYYKNHRHLRAECYKLQKKEQSISAVAILSSPTVEASNQQSSIAAIFYLFISHAVGKFTSDAPLKVTQFENAKCSLSALLDTGNLISFMKPVILDKYLNVSRLLKSIHYMHIKLWITNLFRFWDC